jgi:hypothetical protein
MQWSPAAALFSLFGLLAVSFWIDWWWYPVVFIAVLIASGWAIIKAGKYPI